MAMIEQYFHLSIVNHDVACPYFNNHRTRVRGALRGLIGKGSPDEIIEEATLLALREKIDLAAMTDAEAKKFLVDHHLGIDCSGFVYHVLDTQMRDERHAPLRTLLYFPARTFFRRFVSRLRPAENTDVKTFADEKNSAEVALAHAQPGDLIVLLDIAGVSERDHILLVDQVDENGGIPKTIHYAHAISWSSDGQYDHGVRRGKIDITNPNAPLLNQIWIEKEKIGGENETLSRARGAQMVSLRRLKK